MSQSTINPLDHYIRYFMKVMSGKKIFTALPEPVKHTCGRKPVLAADLRRQIHQALKDKMFDGNRQQIAIHFDVNLYHVRNIAEKGISDEH